MSLRVWRTDEISFDLDDEVTAHPTATVVCRTPVGEVRIMGDGVRAGRVFFVTGAHIAGDGANRLGVAGLVALARAFLEVVDADELVVQGALRTSGRRAGHRPRPFRYRRR